MDELPKRGLEQPADRVQALLAELQLRTKATRGKRGAADRRRYRSERRRFVQGGGALIKGDATEVCGGLSDGRGQPLREPPLMGVH